MSLLRIKELEAQVERKDKYILELELKLSKDFEIGDKVKYKGEVHEVTDVDEGYGYLALGGDRYTVPNHERNNCISAPMGECVILGEDLSIK